jgi:hypothetical protein
MSLWLNCSAKHVPSKFQTRKEFNIVVSGVVRRVTVPETHITAGWDTKPQHGVLNVVLFRCATSNVIMGKRALSYGILRQLFSIHVETMFTHHKFDNIPTGIHHQ